jgi:hypothetical protein
MFQSSGHPLWWTVRLGLVPTQVVGHSPVCGEARRDVIGAENEKSVVVAFVFAVACFFATASSAALAALPENMECAKTRKVQGKYTGKYLDTKCSKEATTQEIEDGKRNKYEIRSGSGKGKPFKGKGKPNGAVVDIEDIGGITCTSDSLTGKFTSPTSADYIVITLKGCEYIGKKCESGSTVGQIVTNSLRAEYGYLEGGGTGTPKVGIDLKAETGEVMAAFKCPSLGWVWEDEWAGSIIGEVTPVNRFTKEVTWTFKQKRVGVQEWEHLEGSPTDILLWGYCGQCAPRRPLEEVTSNGAIETTIVTKGEDLMLKA